MKMILYAGKSLLQLLLQLLIITVKVSNLLSPCLNKLYGPLRDLSKLSQITENYFFYYWNYWITEVFSVTVRIVIWNLEKKYIQNMLSEMVTQL